MGEAQAEGIDLDLEAQDLSQMPPLSWALKDLIQLE